MVTAAVWKVTGVIKAHGLPGTRFGILVTQLHQVQMAVINSIMLKMPEIIIFLIIIMCRLGSL